MDKYLINFADSKYRKSQKINSISGRIFGRFNYVIEYSPQDIDQKFYTEHKTILTNKRGAGLWLWKPYFLLKTLERVNDGDIVMYSDSGAFFCRGIKKMIQEMDEQDVWVSDIPLLEEQWTKPEVFEKLGADYQTIHSPQVQACFIIVRKSEKSMDFINNWLNLCCSEELIMPYENSENKKCIEHREDQSILSVLCKVNKMRIFEDPTQFSKIPEIYKKEGRMYVPTNHNGNRKPIIVHYRNPKIGFMCMLKLCILIWLPQSFVNIVSKTRREKNI